MNPPGRWLAQYMRRQGLDPTKPHDVALAKVRVVYEQVKGGQPTNQAALDVALAKIAERDPQLLKEWRPALDAGIVLVEERSVVDRLAQIEPDTP